MASAVGSLLGSALELFSFVLLIRIVLSWIPSIAWNDQPWRTLEQITEPYLGFFRRFIPPIANLDISPIVAFMVLGFIQSLAHTL
jgi:YggT family protein